MNRGLGINLGSQRQSGGASFNPATLFAGGEQGFFGDITPTTTGVTAGNTVTTLTDSSGRGNNATQATSGLRPTLQTEGGRFYLDWAGAQAMATAAIDLSIRDEVTIIAGVRKGSDASLGLLCETSVNSPINSGSFYFAAPELTGAGGNYTFFAQGASAGPSAMASGTFLAPDLAVMTMTADISADSRILRRNGVHVGTSATDLGTGNFGNFPLFLGARNQASLFFNGRIYGLIVINRILTTPEIAQAEAWMAAKSGVTL